jgi:hypothetical protein
MCPPVLIYREDDRRINTHEALALATRAAAVCSFDTDATLSLLIHVSELEAGIADAVSPDRDRLDALSCAARRATIEAAANWYGFAEHGDRSPEVVRALDIVSRHALPETVPVRISEGYAYYALFPETYAMSAERFWNAARPSRVAVIGIRSIGTSLSAVVVQSLRARGCDTWSCTVRPHGHPFDRRLALAAEVEAAWRDEAARGAVFAIVDEGPGLSGSSFSSVAQAIRALGVPADRIVMFPSWDPDPERLTSGAAQETWRTHRRWCTDAHAAKLTPEAVFGVAAPVIDLSAGAWRSRYLCHPDEWPAVHPQHERWKIAVPSEQRLLRFAGFGPYGQAVRERAKRLHALGLSPPPGRLRHGFLELPFVSGKPLTACRDRIDATEIGRYIGTIARAFPAGDPADTSLLERMIDTNARELLDAASADRIRDMWVDVPHDLPAAFLDARMLAHEWIRSAAGLVKVDALDHHHDHFFPGVQSPAWDLAGAIVELQTDAPASAAMLTEYERISGDRRGRRALPFYKIAYAAFRAGYAAVAARTLAGTDDGERFARARERYLGAITAPSVP